MSYFVISYLANQSSLTAQLSNIAAAVTVGNTVKDLGITADAESIANYEWYNYANAGQSACLTFANEQGAYMLTDISTWLAFQASGGVMG